MIRHIITGDCPNNCSGYEYSPVRLAGIYERLKDHREITITGGEPTSHPYFIHIVKVANKYFDAVHLYTTNPLVLNDLGTDNLFTTVNLGIHGILTDAHVVRIKTPVYAHVMSERYTRGLPLLLKMRKFTGLTIEMDKRRDDDPPDIINITGFSVRINDNKACMEDTFIMPDMKIVNGFHNYL
jgi:MoaA/NifB/PqqE/SkfB family radical SAM enzyme